MRVLSVEYEDGVVYIKTDEGVLEREYTPAMLVPSFVRDFLDLDGVSVIEHEHSLELRAPLFTLLDIQKSVSPLTSAYLFIPPERQFLLDSGLSIHSPIVGGMPSLAEPTVSSPAEARAYLLRSERGHPPRVFVENVLFSHRIAADTSLVDRMYLPPDALRVLLSLNLGPDTVLRGRILLPPTRVRLRLPIPVSLKSTDPIFARRKGGDPVSYADGSIAPLSDAVILSSDYEVVYPVTVTHDAPSSLFSSIFSLLETFRRMASVVGVSAGDIGAVLRRSASREVVSAYSYLQAIADILLPLSSYLASSNALTPLGREAFVAGWGLFQREPKVYSGLYRMNDTCSRALSGLEYFLLALSSLPLELPLWWKRQRA